MSVHIKISATLRPYVKDYDPYTGLDLDYGVHTGTAASLANLLGLPLGEIKFVMVNGRQSPMDIELKDGDRVAYFPAVGGG